MQAEGVCLTIGFAPQDVSLIAAVADRRGRLIVEVHEAFDADGEWHY